MNITLDAIKKLREKTGIGVVDAKKILEETGGDIDKAIDALRRQGQKFAQKKSGRSVKEGFIGSYIHHNGKAGAFVALRCETDFVARNEQFRELAHDLAMQVVAMNPLYVDESCIPAEKLDHERELFKQQMKNSGKPEKLMDAIVEGKLKGFYEEVCLVKQKFFKDNKRTVEDIVAEYIQKLGENIKIESFYYLSI